MTTKANLSAFSKTRFSLLAAMAVLPACGAGNGGDGIGSVANGGAITSGTGGAPAAGGAVNSVGGSTVATGGARVGVGGSSGGFVSGTGGVATGGARSGTGGAATGGSVAASTGGASTSGGALGTGGVVATGGATGGHAFGGQAGRGGAVGQAGSQIGTGGNNASAGVPGGSTLPPVTDYSAPGPFATTTNNNVGPDGKCTVFRPTTLGQNGFLHAPIVFGPGIGMQATALSGLLLSFASHGFVVIGTGVLNGGPNDPANKAAMLNALNWIIQQNTQSGIYQGKLDVTHAISMGYSVGGTAAVEIGGEPAIATTVSIHGHVATAALHGPLLQTSGDKDTVGRPMQQQTYDKSQVQTFFGTVSGADHGYIQQNTGGVERPAIIAWMRYWINNDTGAKHYFWGTDCVLCTSPWIDPLRKNWQ